MVETSPGGVWTQTWTFQTNPSKNIAQATNRTLDFRLNDYDEASFTLPCKSAAAAIIDSFATDLWIWCNDVKVFRGRIVADNDRKGPNGWTVDCKAISYRGLLGLRWFWTNNVDMWTDFTPKPVTEVITDLLGYSHESDTVRVTTTEVAGTPVNLATFFAARGNRIPTWGAYGGPDTAGPQGWGIDPSLIPSTGPVVSRAYQSGWTIGDAIDEIFALVGEWSLDPDHKLHLHQPRRGYATESAPRKLAEPRHIQEWERSFDAAQYGNWIYGVNGTSDPFVETQSGYVTPKSIYRGVIGRVVNFTNLTDLPSVTTQVDKAGNQYSRDGHGWSLVLKPGVWTGPSYVDVGDTIALNINGKPRFVASDLACRITNVHVALADTGPETVTLTAEENA